MSGHTAKPSYFGNLSQFEFPVERESQSYNSDKTSNASHINIERAGSIFIKSGLAKVSPFPSLKDRTLENIINERPRTSDITLEDVATKNMDGYCRNEQDVSCEQDATKNRRGISAQTEDRETKTHINQGSTDESHYEPSLLDSHKKSVLKKRPSLNPKDSISRTKSLVNPYVRRSFIRKYKDEVQGDDLLSKRIKSLSIPAATVNEGTPLLSVAKSDIENLQIPKRSSKRLQNFEKPLTKSNNQGTISRTSQKKIKLNGDSIRSLQTLASDIKTSLGHKGDPKSVDFAALDQLLEELLELNSHSLESSRKSSKSSSTFSQTDGLIKAPCEIEHIENLSPKNQGEKEDGNEKAGNINVKPFNTHKSIRRAPSIKRSVSVLSKEINMASANQQTAYNKPLPKISEEKESICELKRSNAVRRKPRIIEAIINILQVIKRLSKKCWKSIKTSSRRAVSFRRTPSVNKRRTSVRGKRIGEPVLIDIKDSPFKSHVVDGSYSKPGGESAKRNGNSSTETLLPVSNMISNLKSGEDEGDDTRLNSSGDVEDDQLVILWKHYLSKSIASRIDMKMDISQINHLERVKSIQSKSSNRVSIDKIERQEVEKLIEKYVASAETSRSSSILSGPLTINDSSLANLDSSSEFSFAPETPYKKQKSWMSSSATPSSTSRTTSTSTSTSTYTTTSESSDWSTFGSGYDGNSSDDGNSTSISTIEEENSDFYNSASKRSSMSSVEDFFHDDCSVNTAVKENDGRPAKEAGDVVRLNTKTASLVSVVPGASAGPTIGSTIKPSLRMINLKHMINRGKEMSCSVSLKNSVISDSVRRMKSARSSDAVSSVGSTVTTTSTDTDNYSDAFSFQPSIYA